MKRTHQISTIAGAALGLTLSAVASAQSVDRGYEAELAADAAGRASLLQGGSTAGHNNRGFYIGSGDGNYTLYIGGYSQFQYVLSFTDDDDAGEGSDTEDFGNGFDLKRARLIFQGNVINPDLTFYVEGAFDDAADGETSGSEGSFTLLDYWGQYQFDNGVALKWGQFKAPVTRERMVDARHLLAADRSTVDEVFNAGRTQGIALTYRDDNIGLIFSVNDGARSGNTPWHTSAGSAYTGVAGISGAVPAEADISLTLRGDFKLAGDWERFADFTSFRGAQDVAAMIGGAIHWQHGGDTAAYSGAGQVGFPESDVVVYTIDASVEGDGWNVFGAFIGTYGDPDSGDEVDNYGAVVQGGVFVADQWELFGRWDAIFPDDDSAGDDDFHTITVGTNYYFVPESHAAKFTADFQWFLEEPGNNTPVATLAPSSTTALVPSSDDDQFAVRFQMQLAF
ncbi:MAG: porin [Planctomycetota bacterium]